MRDEGSLHMDSPSSTLAEPDLGNEDPLLCKATALQAAGQSTQCGIQ